MHRNQKGWTDLFYDIGALWTHDGNMLRPHALLTSNEHSSGFFNSKLITENRDQTHLREAISDLVEELACVGLKYRDVEGVAGPAGGATKMASGLSVLIYSSRFYISPKPSKTPDGKRIMILTEEEKDLVCGKRVLICDDAATTGGSIDRTIEAVLEAGGIVLDKIPVFVNRSDKEIINGRKIIPLVHMHMPTWNPEAGGPCPYCTGGSEAIRPKDPKNWALLNAPYEELI